MTSTTTTTTTTTTTKRASGFSLIEVLISSAVLLIGITALVMGVHIAIGQHAHNRKLAQALIVAEKRTEALLLLFPTSAELRDGRHPAAGFEFYAEGGQPLPLPAETDPKDLLGFRLFYTVTPSAISEGEDPIIGLRLDIVIAWHETLGERNLVLRTAR